MQFTATKAEHVAMMHIAKRAVAMAESVGIEYTMTTALMDVEACHSNGCRLKLGELLGADDTNFAHDVFGIRRHMDRRTGKLGDCFIPRFAEENGISAVRA